MQDSENQKWILKWGPLCSRPPKKATTRPLDAFRFGTYGKAQSVIKAMSRSSFYELMVTPFCSRVGAASGLTYSTFCSKFSDHNW